MKVGGMKPLRDDPPAELQKWLSAAREVEITADSEQNQSARRGRVLPNLAAAIRQAPVEAGRQEALRRSRSNTWWMAAAAAAVLAIGGAGYGFTVAHSPVADVESDHANLRQVIGKVVLTYPEGSNRVVSPNTGLTSGEEISTTAQAFASVELDDQTRVDVSSATTLRLKKVKPKDNAFYLSSGRVDVNVPKVAGESRHLSVQTPDALVTVRGTIFSVEVDDDDNGSVTFVQVSRGSVAVSSGGRQVVLRAGEQWSSNAQPETSVAGETALPTSVEQATSEPSQTRRSTRPRATSRSTTDATRKAETSPDNMTTGMVSHLAKQNRLFERGLQARDRGNDERAVYWFERLMREHPDSPLLPSASAERTKARERLAE